MVKTFDEVIVISSDVQPAGVCSVCRTRVGMGEGILAVCRGEVVRFGSPACLARFRESPAAYSAGERVGSGLCRESPASEWVV